MTRMVLLLCCLALLGSPARAQNCTKGIPCGRSCIAANKTCRIGAPKVTPANPRQSVTPASSLAPVSTGATALTTPAPAPAATEPAPSTTTHPYVALARGTVYYLRSCTAAKELPREELVYFLSATEAESSGRLRSRVPGC